MGQFAGARKGFGGKRDNRLTHGELPTRARRCPHPCIIVNIGVSCASGGADGGAPATAVGGQFMPAFDSLGHVALRVNDLEKSLDFYARLGFPEFLRLTNDDGTPWICYLRITDVVYLELFPGGDGATVPDTARAGVNHLCLTTPDIEACETHLKSVGVPLESPRNPNRGIDGNRGMWVVDPDGNRIEIMEMAPACIQYEAIKAFNAGKGPTVLNRPLKPKAA
jgi:catechol 2,3-dioxygenase-like lactoylglutathione lyase family enzyme